MRPFILALCSLCLGIATAAKAQTVTIDPLPKNIYCMEETIMVTYTATGNFVQGNAFILQLSDADGSFNEGFINLASMTATGSGSISATLPEVEEGFMYRMRVISSNPVAIGPDNGTDLTIGLPSQASFHSDRQVVIVGDEVSFINESKEGAMYSWSFGNGAVPPVSNSADPGTVTYTTPGIKTIALTVQSQYGCAGTITKTIEVASPNPTLPSTMHIAQSDGVVNAREKTPSVWVCPGGSYVMEMWVHHAYVEPGGHCTQAIVHNDIPIIWAKAGSSVTLRKEQPALVIHEPGVSILNNVHKYNRLIEVPSITFDYTNAPAGGCPSLAPYVKKLPDNVLTIVRELKNDESDREFWVKDGGQLTAEGAENVYAVESGGKVTAQGDNCVIYLKNGATFDAQGSGGHRIFYETEATIINPGAEAALFPSSGVTIVPESVSSVPGVVSEAGGIVLRPNPAGAIVRVDLPTDAGTIRRIRIHNMLGATVYEASGPELNVDSLPSGLYHVQVETEHGTYLEPLMVR